VLEAMPAAFFSLSKNWEFTYLNAHAERLLEAVRRDALGQLVWEAGGGSDDLRSDHLGRHSPRRHQQAHTALGESQFTGAGVLPRTEAAAAGLSQVEGPAITLEQLDTAPSARNQVP
jgi:hypothetical protein